MNIILKVIAQNCYTENLRKQRKKRVVVNEKYNLYKLNIVYDIINSTMVIWGPDLDNKYPKKTSAAAWDLKSSPPEAVK